MNKTLLTRAAIYGVSILIMSQSVSTVADNMFIGGRIEFVQLYDEGFTIKFRDAGGVNPAEGCLNTRIYVLDASHSDKLSARAYEMALMAVINDKRMSIVIDKNINGPGGLCEATSGNMLARPF